MHLPTIHLPTLLSLALLSSATSSAPPNPSFAGINLPQLQYLTPSARDATILSLVASNVRVIRLQLRPTSLHTDFEPTLGTFDKSLLDQTDDALAAIHRLSGGRIKVVLAPHDAGALLPGGEVPCDAYCEGLGGAYLDFYSGEEWREKYWTRLEVLLRHYPSKNFGGRGWGELDEVIMAVDIQSRPFAPIHPIPAGEPWLCATATYLRTLLSPSIGVSSGGVSGTLSPGGTENAPAAVLKCDAIDIVGVHAGPQLSSSGLAALEDVMAEAQERAEARDAGAKPKLLLVESWTGPHDADALAAQARALDERGIPWLYTHVPPSNTSSASASPPTTPFTPAALAAPCAHAASSRARAGWAAYLPPLSSLPPLPLVAAQAQADGGADGKAGTEEGAVDMNALLQGMLGMDLNMSAEAVAKAVKGL
ncbi:hypothetical protein C7974DRAFT_441601 [Boeremia exigua]|uniref:uncharacterized protein n=1 Tax=Boeremia exigua TaxID=749465 RepID=UPI001E8CAF23|nr:uncharacterized protein C7974DRAFT_441601 [Boeremia exigua]KAH6618989.1 hypothetical protein C7974DRAFT_441601 [Boeremia exigua]